MSVMFIWGNLWCEVILPSTKVKGYILNVHGFFYQTLSIYFSSVCQVQEQEEQQFFEQLHRKNWVTRKNIGGGFFTLALKEGNRCNKNGSKSKARKNLTLSILH